MPDMMPSTNIAISDDRRAQFLQLLGVWFLGDEIYPTQKEQTTNGLELLDKAPLMVAEIDLNAFVERYGPIAETIRAQDSETTALHIWRGVEHPTIKRLGKPLKYKLAVMEDGGAGMVYAFC